MHNIVKSRTTSEDEDGKDESEDEDDKDKMDSSNHS